MMERLLRITEVASLLGRSVKTIRRRVAAGIIPAIQEGGPGTELRFDPLDIRELLESSKRVRLNGKGTAVKTERSEQLAGPMPKWKSKKTI